MEVTRLMVAGPARETIPDRPRRTEPCSLKLRANGFARTALVSMVVCSFFLTGCLIGPDYVRPEANVSAEWMKSYDQRIVGEPADSAEWWKTFNDPTLNSLIEEAYSQNLTLQAAALRIVQVRAGKRMNYWLLGPYLGLRASAKHINFSQNVDPSLRLNALGSRATPSVKALNISFLDSIDIYSYGLTSFWEPDIWGGVRRGIKAAKADESAAIASYDDILVALTAEVARVYVIFRTHERRLEILDESIANLESFLESVEARKSAEKSVEIDIEMLNAILTRLRSRRPPIKSNIETAVGALSLLLGIRADEMGERLAGSGGIPVAPSEVALGIPADLLRRRPDVRRAERMAAAQSEKIGQTKAKALLPDLSLFGLVGFATSHSRALTGSSSQNGAYGAGFRWNILLYPATVNVLRAEDAKFQELIANYKQTVLHAAQEVESSSSAYLSAQDQLPFLEQSEAAIQRATDLSSIQYSEGSLAFSQVFDCIDTLTESKNLVVIAQSNIALNLIALYKATGGGWEIKEGTELLPESVKEEMRERTDWKTFGGKSALERPVPKVSATESE